MTRIVMAGLLGTICLLGLVGCGEDPVDVVIDAEPITAPGHYIRNFGVDGLPRNFEVYVPPSVDFSSPAPLILAFHGNPQSAANLRGMTQLDREADRTGAVVVYPNKANGADWHWGCDICSIAAQNSIDDDAYVNAVIDKMSLDMSIDPNRIYATGFSQGGLMTFRMACMLEQRFAAFAPVGALMWEWQRKNCLDNAQRPILIIIGVEDDQFHWEGEVGGIGESLPGEEVRDHFATRNGCEDVPTESMIPDVVEDGTTTTVQAYVECTGDKEVLFYRIDGGGHAWPGSPADFGPARPKSEDFSASRVIVDFFLSHTR